MPASSFCHHWWCLTPSFPLITSLHLLDALPLSSGLPHTGDWLNGVLSFALPLNLQDCEFHCCLCYWLVVPLYNDHYTCMEWLYTAKIYGDHQMGCGTNGDQVSWYNTIQNVIFCVAQSRTLAPSKESPPPSGAQLGCHAKWHLFPNWSHSHHAVLDLHIIFPHTSTANSQGDCFQLRPCPPGQVVVRGASCLPIC